MQLIMAKWIVPHIDTKNWYTLNPQPQNTGTLNTEGVVPLYPSTLNHKA